MKMNDYLFGFVATLVDDEVHFHGTLAWLIGDNDKEAYEDEQAMNIHLDRVRRELDTPSAAFIIAITAPSDYDIGLMESKEAILSGEVRAWHPVGHGDIAVIRGNEQETLVVTNVAKSGGRARLAAGVLFRTLHAFLNLKEGGEK